jgi:cobalt/nickel transport system permease protein
MSFEKAYFTIGRLDRLSYQDTVVHRLDPRAKVVATMLFVFTVASYPKYEVLSLVPFSLFPVLLTAFGDIPVGFLIRKILLVSPFALFIGIFNPLFDGGIVVVAGVPLSAGWLSFLSIIVKFSLTISAALLLIATTSFAGVCRALRRLGFPAIFVSQLLFLYRYLFVLMEEAMRMVRARDLRSFGGQGRGARVTARLIGNLLMRTVERAERVYSAMLSRGFRGEMPTVTRHRFSAVDALFVTVVVACLVLFRTFPVSELIGRFVQEVAG